MEGFINWGSESPEQKRIRQRWEEDLLFEQARMKAMAMQAAGAVGSGRAGCTERDGITISWIYPEPLEDNFTLFQRAFLTYTGPDKDGNATFGLVTDQYISDFGTDELSIKLRKSGDQWLLELFQSFSEGSQVTVIAQAPDLYEGWIGLEYEDEGQILQDITAACGDQTYRRLCITIQDDSPFGTFTSIIGGIESIIPQISEEYPAGYGGFDRSQVFWSPKDSRWGIAGTIIEDADDITQPPIGTFDTERGTATITEGSCTGEVPTPPGPTLITTSDIQVDMTMWKWSGGFDGLGLSAGSIGPFLIDGQSGDIGSIEELPEGAYTFIITVIDPNVYQVTLPPAIVGSNVNLSIGMDQYKVVSMILNLTTDGTDPRSTTDGTVLDIEGTITYEADGSVIMA